MGALLVGLVGPFRRSALALLVTLAAGCGSAQHAGTTPPPEPPPDRCVIALRLAQDETRDETPNEVRDEAPREEPPPTTTLSLVRICDQHGRVVTSLGAREGVCQHEAGEPRTRGVLLRARCWWPGQDASVVQVVREGQRVSAWTHGEGDEERRELLGSVEVPERARLDVLSPGHRPRP